MSDVKTVITSIARGDIDTAREAFAAGWVTREH